MRGRVRPFLGPAPAGRTHRGLKPLAVVRAVVDARPSSSIPNVWNIWIIYPFMAWVLFIATNVAYVVVRKPISEDEIRQEMRRRSGT